MIQAQIMNTIYFYSMQNQYFLHKSDPIIKILKSKQKTWRGMSAMGEDYFPQEEKLLCSQIWGGGYYREKLLYDTGLAKLFC